MKKIKNIFKKKQSLENYFIIAFIVLTVFAFIYAFYSYHLTNEEKISGGPSNQTFLTEVKRQCIIEFGKPKCKNGKLIIPFYNPTNSSYNLSFTNITVIARTKEGKDIYNVREPLEMNQTETLELMKCYSIEDMNITWCCDTNCYIIPMANYTKDLTIGS